jgi:hypothetical protein
MRARIKRRQRVRRLTIIITIAVIAASLVVAFYYALNNSSPCNSVCGKPISATIFGELKDVSNSTLNSVGSPSGIVQPSKISGSPLTSGGKPLVLYVGGDYCPYCAFERWGLAVALLRFGNFSNLEYMLSSSSDVNPNTPTFTFSGATYTSEYIAFTGVEEYGGDPNTVIQALTSEQQSLVTQYGKCPATGTVGIPFVDLGNSYVINCGAQSTIDISGMNWTQVAGQLNTPSSSVAMAIDGAANSLITAICNIDGHQPSQVCSQSYATLNIAYAPGPQDSESALLVTLPSRVGFGSFL